MPKLYEIASDLQQVEEILADLVDSEVEEREELEQTLKDTLESLEMAFEDKIENVYKLMKSFEGEAKMYKDEKDRLAKLEQASRNKAERLKQYIIDSMTLAGIDYKNKRKVETSIGKLGFQKNPPTVEILDEELIPYEYISRIERHYDKRALTKLAKEQVGDVEEVELEKLGIKYVNNRFHLRVR